MNKYVYSQSRKRVIVSSLIKVPNMEIFIDPRNKCRMSDEWWNVLMVEYWILCLWIRLIFLLKFLSFFLPPSWPDDTNSIRAEDCIARPLIFYTLKSEVMVHFRVLLLHTPSCQYTVITNGPFSSEIKIAYMHLKLQGCTRDVLTKTKDRQ